MDAKMDEKLPEQEVTLQSVDVKCQSLFDTMNQLGGYVDQNFMQIDKGLTARDQNIAQSFQMLSVGIAGLVGRLDALSDFLEDKLEMDKKAVQDQAVKYAEEILVEQEKRIKEAVAKQQAEQQVEKKLPESKLDIQE